MPYILNSRLINSYKDLGVNAPIGKYFELRPFPTPSNFLALGDVKARGAGGETEKLEVMDEFYFSLKIEPTEVMHQNLGVRR